MNLDQLRNYVDEIDGYSAIHLDGSGVGAGSRGADARA